jgi:hypothetical protein
VRASCPPALTVSGGPGPSPAGPLSGFVTVDREGLAGPALARWVKRGARLGRIAASEATLTTRGPCALAATAWPGEHGTVRDALRIVVQPEHLRRTLMIAVVVGTVLTAINHADVIGRGDATTATLVKSALNYLVPFIVSNLGLLVGTRDERG